MPPSKWDDESDGEGNSPAAPIVRRGKFDDEEDEDEVLDSWDAAEDSEVEREKERKAAEAKAKAEAEARANHKTKSQRMEDRIKENKLKKQAAADDSDEDEDEATRRARLRKSEMDSDLAAAEDLFGDLAIGGGSKRSATKPAVMVDPNDSNNTIDLSTLKIFNPSTKDDFHKLRDTLAPLLAANSKKPQYNLFLQEFCKQIAKELPSDQIKKISSGLTTLSNEKMKEEKAAEKGGKKSKAAKTKTSLNATRDVAYKADTATYDEDFGE
ncbi:Translation initiation factor 3 subunit J component [Diplodia seriata]|uniref:Eukaryotic translation initiation factor 3 subunit J n=2 Tax=Diplodia seriata TaxID=420778 RepID=A0A0G2GM13_9PEZI|nr:putative eukaryotic translation initiation factor 3 subunit j [Diplodia seriata]